MYSEDRARKLKRSSTDTALKRKTHSWRPSTTSCTRALSSTSVARWNARARGAPPPRARTRRVERPPSSAPVDARIHARVPLRAAVSATRSALAARACAEPESRAAQQGSTTGGGGSAANDVRSRIGSKPRRHAHYTWPHGTPRATRQPHAHQPNLGVASIRGGLPYSKYFVALSSSTSSPAPPASLFHRLAERRRGPGTDIHRGRLPPRATCSCIARVVTRGSCEEPFKPPGRPLDRGKADEKSGKDAPGAKRHGWGRRREHTKLAAHYLDGPKSPRDQREARNAGKSDKRAAAPSRRKPEATVAGVAAPAILLETRASTRGRECVAEWARGVKSGVRRVRAGTRARETNAKLRRWSGRTAGSTWRYATACSAGGRPSGVAEAGGETREAAGGERRLAAGGNRKRPGKWVAVTEQRTCNGQWESVQPAAVLAVDPWSRRSRGGNHPRSRRQALAVEWRLGCGLGRRDLDNTEAAILCGLSAALPVLGKREKRVAASGGNPRETDRAKHAEGGRERYKGGMRRAVALAGCQRGQGRLVTKRASWVMRGRVSSFSGPVRGFPMSWAAMLLARRAVRGFNLADDYAGGDWYACQWGQAAERRAEAEALVVQER
ncbi:hypothetical protein GGX14DRAFT_647451 [Mycena pura]|uniref:Uncharacterized protein n=1 Tax=Mycena pura TaxID=153505 RepID=A0AAD6YBH9_9AGAR|nr:hypothetical protein GGX14DRAFT_647451 [Mycena pura]